MNEMVGIQARPSSTARYLSAFDIAMCLVEGGTRVGRVVGAGVFGAPVLKPSFIGARIGCECQGMPLSFLVMDRVRSVD